MVRQESSISTLLSKGITKEAVKSYTPIKIIQTIISIKTIAL